LNFVAILTVEISLAWHVHELESQRVLAMWANENEWFSIEASWLIAFIISLLLDRINDSSLRPVQPMGMIKPQREGEQIFKSA